MPLRDVAAMNASLNNDYGATHGANSPASFLLALFVGDPMIAEVDGGGTEANSTDQPGYARAAVTHAMFGPASDGLKTTVVGFAAPTAAWTTSITHWALLAVTTGVVWDTGPLGDELTITGSGPGPLVEIAIFYGDNVTSEDE